MHILTKAACGLPLLLSLTSTSGWATTLSEALSAAESYSAELSANDHQVNALKNMADSAMELPDPKLKFGLENVPLGGSNASRLTREGMTMQRIGVMQDYVSSTKRERKADSITAATNRRQRRCYPRQATAGNRSGMAGAGGSAEVAALGTGAD